MNQFKNHLGRPVLRDVEASIGMGMNYPVRVSYLGVRNLNTRLNKECRMVNVEC